MVLKVIGAGFSRTGTLSLKQALEHLGLGKCWHGLDVFTDPEIIDVFTNAAMGEPVDFATMFDNDVSSVVDFAGMLFYKQLFEANPDAKVIITVRDEEAWYKSVYNAIWTYGQRKDSFPQLKARGVPLKWLVRTQMFKDKFEDKQHTLALYRSHLEEVQRLIPKEKLLVYRVSDGWTPLCEFLGVDVPTIPFPMTNSTKEHVDMIAKMHNEHEMAN